MATVITHEDAKVNEHSRTSKNGTTVNVTTPFLVNRDNPDLPLVQMSKYPPGRRSQPHYHTVPQFQIMIDGRGKLGRHDIKANSVHFSHAYTPYGPFTAADDSSLTCLIIRSTADPGAQDDPEAWAALSRMPDRNPWQATHDVTYPELGSANVVLQAVSELDDNDMATTYALRMKPGATVLTPDPSVGEGLFVVVKKGSLIHENKEAKALTLVHVSTQEKPFEIRAGAEGLEGLIVRFPNPVTKSAATAKGARPGAKSYHCTLCSFVYDEAAGLPEEGIAPGTRWEDVPANWTCPDCAADKSGFERFDS